MHGIAFPFAQWASGLKQVDSPPEGGLCRDIDRHVEFICMWSHTSIRVVKHLVSLSCITLIQQLTIEFYWIANAIKTSGQGPLGKSN